MANMLFRKQIKVAEINETLAVSSITSSAVSKVFCAIYSCPGNSNQTDAIRRTFGGRCDGFMTASTTETNHDLATVNFYLTSEIGMENIMESGRKSVGRKFVL